MSDNARMAALTGRPVLHGRQMSSPQVARVRPSPIRAKTSVPLSPPPGSSGANFNSVTKEDVPDDSNKSPFTYALHVVFTSFVRLAERKINSIVTSATDQEPDVAAAMASGADVAFDKVLRNLAFIAKQNPKPVIDSVMFWRKSRAELRSDSGSHIVPEEAASRRHEMRPSLSRTNTANADAAAALAAREASILADRKGLVSIYILCRTLIELIKQVNETALSVEVGEKLEEIVYNQLRSADPDLLMQSPLRLANWNLFVELLGALSAIRFVSVSDRFIADIEKYGRGMIQKDRETFVEMLITGMRHLKLRLYPAQYLEDSAEFVLSLSKFFIESHGFRIKRAYASVLNRILLPVAGVATAEVSFPQWVEATGVLYPRAVKMLEKGKYWDVAFPLCCTVLCVSPQQQFSSRWYPLLEANASRLKEKFSQLAYVEAIARLMWVACFRAAEPLTTLFPRFEALLRLTCPVTRRVVAQPSDVPKLPVVTAASYLGLRFPEQTFKLLLNDFIGHDLQRNDRVSLDNVNADRATLALSAIHTIAVVGARSGGDSPFPVEFTDTTKEDVDLSQTPLKGVLATTFEHHRQSIGDAVVRLLYLLENLLNDDLDQPLRTPTAVMSPMVQGLHGRDRYAYLELAVVALNIAPVVLSPKHISAKLVELLCRATQSGDADAQLAARSALLGLSRRRHAQPIVAAYTRVILRADGRPRPGMQDRIELYLDLLRTWLGQVREDVASTNQKASTPENTANGEIKNQGMLLNTVWPIVDEAEAAGMLLLCSQSRLLRGAAIKILSLVKEFDASDGGATQADLRIIDVLENESGEILMRSLDNASVAERGRVTKLRHEQETVLKVVAESESGVDAAIWFKAFPHIIRRAFEIFPTTTVITRNIICERLPRMQEMITASLAQIRTPAPFDVVSLTTPKTLGSPESLVDQWRLYLMVACITLTSTEESTTKAEQKKTAVSATRITSARGVFSLILPFLTSDSSPVRDSVVTALGCINVNLFKPLLEDLRPMMRLLAEQSAGGTPARGNVRKLDLLRQEITNILQLTSRFLQDKSVSSDTWIVNTLLGFLKDTKVYLMQDDIQNSFEHQRLRRHFSHLLKGIWDGLTLVENAQELFPFEGRISCFRLVEEWCGHGTAEAITNARADYMRKAIISRHRDIRDQGALTATMELEKRQVEQAALQAMASLCKGPIYQAVESAGVQKITMSLDIDALLAWFAALFNSSSEKTHEIGRRALSAVLCNNASFPKLYQAAVHQCYTHDFESRAARSYFLVLAGVLMQEENLPCPLPQLVALCLFKAGDKSFEVRRRTLELLKSIETRAFGSSCVDTFEAMICNQNPVIYKKAQYLLAARLAIDHEQMKFLLFSECSKFFRLVETRLQRDVVAILLPWLQTIELTDDASDEQANDLSHMVLVNLFEITLRFSDTLLNEIEGLWAVLLAKPTSGNAKVILDFIMAQSVARREPKFVRCAKQVIVYLSRSPLGVNLLPALLLHLEPRSMIPLLREAQRPSLEGLQLPYVADLDRVFDVQQRGVVFSLGQLALVFIVDLLVEPVPGLVTHVPLMLQAVFVMLDHYIPLVQEQARELLMYLGYNLTMHVDTDPERRAQAVEFLKSIRQRESKGFWAYDELACPDLPKRVPANLGPMVEKVLTICEGAVPDLRRTWSKLALQWATSCPVRHMACRAFQVYRCLAVDVSQETLADMLARLSNTIADDSKDIEAFAMEILYTMHHVVASMEAKDFASLPQLFWATAACLDTIHEDEFMEACKIIDLIIAKVDLAAEENVDFLLSQKPSQWDGAFAGLFRPLLKGVRSEQCSDSCLRLLNQLIRIPSNPVVGGDSRMLDCLLHNLPVFVREIGEGGLSPESESAANAMAIVAQAQGHESLSRTLTSVAKGRFRNSEEFAKQIVGAIRSTFLPQHEAHVLITWLGLLSHRAQWMKVCTMDLLKALLPYADTSRVEFAGVGADLISPLLRLLQTELAPQALEVLDKAIAIRSGPKDRQVLRMSLGNRLIRKEYEKTATLFGIPEDSGWAIPMPLVAAASTRANIHAVFYTCTPEDAQADDTSLKPVQFHIEEYNYRAPSDRSDTMMSIDATESNLGDMVSALHNLDVFFAEDSTVGAAKTAVATGPNHVADAAPATVYDSRVAAILARSLTRTPSTSSFTSPGFDTSPQRNKKAPASPSTDRVTVGSPLASGYAFPRQARPGVTPPYVATHGKGSSADQPGFLSPSRQRIDCGTFDDGKQHNVSTATTVVEDNRSEASFKLDTLLRSEAPKLHAANKTSSRKQQNGPPVFPADSFNDTLASSLLPAAAAAAAQSARSGGKSVRQRLWASSDKHKQAAAAAANAMTQQQQRTGGSASTAQSPESESGLDKRSPRGSPGIFTSAAGDLSSSAAVSPAFDEPPEKESKRARAARALRRSKTPEPGMHHHHNLHNNSNNSSGNHVSPPQPAASGQGGYFWSKG
ncbi:Cell morphoproteinsis protein PAG1 [Savitreella phatthalungensis]